MKRKSIFSFEKAVAGVLFLLIVGVFACTKSDTGTPSNPPANQVYIQSMAFNPSNITVSNGTTITWTNNDGITHTVTANDNSYDSGNMATGASFTHTFSHAGTYNYHCKIHSNMTGVVVVVGQ